MRLTHWTGLCNLKPENVSPSCRDIIVSMLWEMNFYLQLLCLHVLTFWGKKQGTPPHATPLLTQVNLYICIRRVFIPYQQRAMFVSYS